jgi:hypothetical protein
MNRIKRIGSLTAAFSATIALLSVTAAPNTVSADNHDPFADGDELLVYVNILSGDSIQGGHLDGWVNEHPAGDDFSQIGGIGLVRLPDGCSELSCAEWHVGYCSEPDEQIHVMEYEPYYETSLDPRLSYLTWKYGYDFYIANSASGDAIAPMAATQALVWAWHSDLQTGSSVFANVAGGLDDPFNWDGLTPSQHTDTSPRVGFHGDDLGATYWTGTDEALLQTATQAVYDLAVEATAKAGPWTLSQGVGASGVVLSGANGPIEGEVVNFQDGTTDGIDVTTDVNGFAAWPNGTTAAHAEGPGLSYETQGNSDQGEEGQNVVLTLGELLVVNVDDPAPTTTTTTTTTTSTTTTTLPQSDNEAPTTTTTTPDVELTTTTNALTGTTTTISLSDPPSSPTTFVATTTAGDEVSTSSIADPPALPATGRSSTILPAVLVLATGFLGVFAGRRRQLR